MVAEKFFNLSSLSFFQWNIVRISAKNVLELAFKLVDIIVMFSSELKLDFFVLGLISFLFLGSLVEILP